jgi:uncharacterized protein (DUF2235 family)
MAQRPQRTHVFIIDGTLSRLLPGFETNAGITYKLLSELGPRIDQTVAYDPGVQGEGLRKWIDVAAGEGLNKSIERGYAVLASRYHPGDRIMLFGFSRGAYAVRSLAGFIGRIGLLKSHHATERRVNRAFRYYESATLSEQAMQFTEKYCHSDVVIDLIGVWDTVRALGLPYPVLTRLAPMATEFHDHTLGPGVRNAFHALALDETRTAFEPILWERAPGWTGRLEQVWFPGAHADIGGQCGPNPRARGLTNIPLRWMLERAAALGLRLPAAWQSRFPTDPAAPMVGCWTGTARWFLMRAPRVAGTDASERQHASVGLRSGDLPAYRPRALWSADTAPGEDPADTTPASYRVIAGDRG